MPNLFDIKSPFKQGRQMFTRDIIQSFQVHGLVQYNPVCICPYSLHCEYQLYHFIHYLKETTKLIIILTKSSMFFVGENKLG